MTEGEPPRGAVRRDIDTAAGRLAAWDRPGDGPALLFVHGNTSSKEAFRPLLEEPALDGLRLIAIDLPGAGDSADAIDPAANYTIPAMARTVAAAASALGLAAPVVVGWSLGGHIAIEAAAQGMALTGLVLTGTPPTGPGAAELADTFHQSEIFAVGVTEAPTEAALSAYAAAVYGNSAPGDALLAASRRFDGRFRQNFAEHWLSGREGAAQRAFVASWPGPIAVIQGVDEPFFDPAIVDRMIWANLWRGRSQLIPGAGHAPFLQRPKAYAQLLLAFLADLEPLSSKPAVA